jgi:hypothetical protein
LIFLGWQLEFEETWTYQFVEELGFFTSTK